MSRYRLSITVNLEADLPDDLDAKQLDTVLQTAHFRAEQFVARVIVCGDEGGAIKLEVERGDTPVAAIAKRVTTLEGRATAKRLRS